MAASAVVSGRRGLFYLNRSGIGHAVYAVCLNIAFYLHKQSCAKLGLNLSVAGDYGCHIYVAVACRRAAQRFLFVLDPLFWDDSRDAHFCLRRDYQQRAAHHRLRIWHEFGQPNQHGHGGADSDDDSACFHRPDALSATASG